MPRTHRIDLGGVKVPQITITVSDDVYRALQRLEKGKKSKFANSALRYMIQNVCWDRLEFMKLAMFQAWDALHEAKTEELDL
tara:strand:- start:155 stop:400 length:246 start_codon:yes stop_codon:yes gene_type:complete